MGNVMKQGTNGNYFQIWLQEYRIRLQKVSLQSSDNTNQDDAQPTDGAYTAIRDEAPSHPATAGDLYLFFQPSANL